VGLPPDVEDALRRSAVVWVGLDGRPPRAVWHVWHDGALWLVAGGGEQDLPGAGDATSAQVVVRARGALAGRLAELTADVEQVRPDDQGWEDTVGVLAAARLNGPDPAALPERWAAASTVLRLDPRSGTDQGARTSPRATGTTSPPTRTAVARPPATSTAQRIVDGRPISAP
jgi:hypothetical protein